MILHHHEFNYHRQKTVVRNGSFKKVTEHHSRGSFVIVTQLLAIKQLLGNLFYE